MQIGHRRDYLDDLLLPHDNHNYNNNNTEHIKVELVMISGKSYEMKVNKYIPMVHLNDMIIYLLLKDKKFIQNDTLGLFHNKKELIIDDSTLFEKIGQQTDIELTIIIRKKNYNIVCNELITAVITNIGHIVQWGEYTNNNKAILTPNEYLEENKIFTMLTCGSDYTAGLTSRGRVLCWGSGLPRNVLKFIRIPKLEIGETYFYVTGYVYHAVAITSQRIISWRQLIFCINHRYI